MKKILVFIIGVVFVSTLSQEHVIFDKNISTQVQNTDGIIQKAYDNKQSDLQVQGNGVVVKILADDRQGSRHQRFILKLSSGHTLLVAHNIDLSQKITSLKKSDSVEFYGEYEWNAEGGIVHWTHRDLRGKHIGGWLKHNGKIYQ